MPCELYTAVHAGLEVNFLERLQSRASKIFFH